MAKKKSSAKQTKKTSPKKPSSKKTVTKAAPKKKTAVKKAAPKAAAKKKALPVKKAAKKAPLKKVASKKAVAKSTAKSMVKKTVAKKAAPKAKTSTKASSKAANKPTVKAQIVKASAPAKKLDLSNFVTPLDDRLIVQLSSAEKMTPGGLYIPATVSDVSGNLEGIVVSAGRGHFSKKGHLRPMDVKLGDKVVFPEYAGSKIKIQNEDLVIIRESDVMGVVAK